MSVSYTHLHSNNFAPISSDTKENQLCNLEPDKLKECFEMTLEALERALKFIENLSLIHIFPFPVPGYAYEARVFPLHFLKKRERFCLLYTSRCV